MEDIGGMIGRKLASMNTFTQWEITNSSKVPRSPSFFLSLLLLRGRTAVELLARVPHSSKFCVWNVGSASPFGGVLKCGSVSLQGILIGGAAVITRNQPAINGYFHVIDKVRRPDLAL